MLKNGRTVKLPMESGATASARDMKERDIINEIEHAVYSSIRREKEIALRKLVGRWLVYAPFRVSTSEI